MNFGFLQHWRRGEGAQGITIIAISIIIISILAITIATSIITITIIIIIVAIIITRAQGRRVYSVMRLMVYISQVEGAINHNML